MDALMGFNRDVQPGETSTDRSFVVEKCTRVGARSATRVTVVVVGIRILTKRESVMGRVAN